ncbi:DEAD/DEAH box helicase [Halorientalis brevis]|uniref:Putative DNA 3'-5' helicase Rad25 n=1 Tax=Halorientalis brevis TaxID=1126241 RepID=A0ABD6CDC8_9EURY
MTDNEEPAEANAGEDAGSTAADEQPSETDEATTLDSDGFTDVIQDIGRPVVTASRVAQALDCSQSAATEALDALAGEDLVQKLDVSTDPVVWYPTDWSRLTDRERVILFPGRRQIVVDHPTQFTRAQLSQFAHLVDTTHRGGYLYEVRREDVWGAPYDTFEDLLGTIRDVLPERSPALEEWIEDQWKRAHQFTLRTHEDGYVVLEAATENLMGNVAREKLDDEQLRAPISDSESWVAEEAVAEVKRILYEAGYPVQDERDLETGEDLDLDLTLDLRDYQHAWVSQFMETKSGVLVGPPGAGKTVAALGILARVGGETLVLVPSRELAGQWREEILARTTLTPAQIGEYHGGTKQVRPITIATYQTAGMDRHRQLFDSREWGLVIYDEVHHIPSAVYRRSANLQTKHRLGLSSTPVREDDKEEDIYTLIGPPIGTDWDALFDAGFVAEPEVEIRYVPWASDDVRNEYVSSDGHERRQLAATNPAKIDETRHLLSRHANKKALVFADYLDQGRAFSAALDVPFVNGEMPHSKRERLLEEFRQGMRDTLIVSRVGDEGIDLPDAELAIVASGLGGSRRQGAQRAGRTMRPEGRSLVFVLATRGSNEEDFAQRRMRHLSSKGVRVTEGEAEAVETTN